MCQQGIFVLLVLLGATTTNASAPEQIHVSLGGTRSEMHVLWATKTDVTSWVVYGKEGGPMTKRQEGEVVQLRQDNRKACNFIHRAVLGELEGGVQYRYRVHSSGNDSVEFASPPYTFTTLPTTQTRPLTFLVFGDLGVRGGSDTFPALQTEVNDRNHTAVWHVGDLAYDLFADGGWVGDEFLRRLEPVAANIPYMVAPGNHEIGNGDFHHYRTRFSIPGAAWPIPVDRMWYSYDIGLVHFISYSTEVFFTYQETYECGQYYWLLEDIVQANENRHNVPWVVAVGHRPMYCSNDNGDDCTGLPFRGRVRAGLENLFHSQGVDLIIEAHEHSYERLWPVFNHDVIQTNYINPRGSVHVISGAAGNQEGKDTMVTDAKPWSAYRHATPRENNFGRLHVVNETHLYWEQVRVKDAQAFDSFWLVQHAHGPFVQGVNCTRSGGHSHSSCTCPPPFFLWILLDVGGFIAGVVAVVVVVRVVVRRRRRRRNGSSSHRRSCCWQRRWPEYYLIGAESE